MTTLTIKNVPEGLYERLIRWAAVNKRSVNSEVIARLEESIPDPEIDFDINKPPPTHLFEELVEETEKLAVYMDEKELDPDEMIAEFKELRKLEKQKKQAVIA